ADSNVSEFDADSGTTSLQRKKQFLEPKRTRDIKSSATMSGNQAFSRFLMRDDASPTRLLATTIITMTIATWTTNGKTIETALSVLYPNGITFERVQQRTGGFARAPVGVNPMVFMVNDGVSMHDSPGRLRSVGISRNDRAGMLKMHVGHVTGVRIDQCMAWVAQADVALVSLWSRMNRYKYRKRVNLNSSSTVQGHESSQKGNAG
ncbi:hypothetical protein PENSPDRAFT_672655, partial [Peniophora sp. CONT]